MRHDQIALQLYTVRSLLAEDLPGTLTAVARSGYRSVELAALHDVPADDLARHLDDAGLSPVASHEGIDRLRSDARAVAERMRVLHCPRVVVPWMPPADRESFETVRRFAAELGRLSEVLAADGLRLGYHNHDFEFAPLEGTTAFEVLLAELPADVELEVDVYWVSVGGREPVATIEAARDRVRMLHMKDRAPGAAVHDAPAGSGLLDVPAIVEAGRSAGVDWYVVELDEPGDAIADITAAAAYLESLAG